MLIQKTNILLSDKLVFFNKKIKYITKIRSIIYTIIKIKLDIIFAMSMVNDFAKNLGLDYFSIIDQILRYLISDIIKITFRRESKLNFIEYLDFD